MKSYPPYPSTPAGKSLSLSTKVVEVLSSNKATDSIFNSSKATKDSTLYTKILEEALEVPVTGWEIYLQLWILGTKGPKCKEIGYKK